MTRLSKITNIKTGEVTATEYYNDNQLKFGEGKKKNKDDEQIRNNKDWSKLYNEINIQTRLFKRYKGHSKYQI